MIWKVVKQITGYVFVGYAFSVETFHRVREKFDGGSSDSAGERKDNTDDKSVP